MSDTFESVQRNVCVHRLDLDFMLSSEIVLVSEPTLTPTENPLYQKHSPQRIEPMMLHQAGQ